VTKTLLEKIGEIEKAVGKDWLKEFQEVDSAQKIITLADQHGVTVTEEIAEEAFNLMNESEISDEQLMDISGGGLYIPVTK